MFVFQFHLCEEKAGKHDVVYFREYWIFCHLRQRSRISSERQYTGLRKSVSPPCRFIYEQKDDDLLKMFWRCSLKRWMSQGCVPLSPCVKNRFYAKTPSLQLPPPDSTQITTFKSEVAKVLSAAPPWSDQKLVTDKINFHFSSYGRVWSSRSWGDYPRKRVIGPSSQYHIHTLDWPGRITEGTKVVREEQICEVSSMCIVRLEGVGFMCF